MKSSLFLILFICLFSFCFCEKNDNFYDLNAVTIEGDTITMNQYIDKMIMIVNVASKCRYTEQYSELEKLYSSYDSTLIILGFPSNDFLWQESGSNEEIKLFCQRNYGITFQMFEKIHVKGKNKHPIYEWLSTADKNGWNDKSPKWNFYKYIINREGKLINYFPSNISPLDSSIIKLFSN